VSAQKDGLLEKTLQECAFNVKKNIYTSAQKTGESRPSQSIALAARKSSLNHNSARFSFLDGTQHVAGIMKFENLRKR